VPNVDVVNVENRPTFDAVGHVARVVEPRTSATGGRVIDLERDLVWSNGDARWTARVPMREAR
jgi:hypothetical protein